jgi:hypothetical protein
VDSKIAVVEYETIERLLVAVYWHDVWNEAYERLLGFRGDWTDGDIVRLPSDHIAYIADCGLDLRPEKSKAKLACRSDGNGERFRLLFKEAFAKPSSSKIGGEIEAEQ